MDFAYNKVSWVESAEPRESETPAAVMNDGR
jgi:hypothetical protein